MSIATKTMIAFWFMCPLQNNNNNYGNNNKVKKWEQIKGKRVELGMITIIFNFFQTDFTIMRYNLEQKRRNQKSLISLGISINRLKLKIESNRINLVYSIEFNYSVLVLVFEFKNSFN